MSRHLALAIASVFMASCAPEPNVSLNVRQDIPEKGLPEIQASLAAGQEQRLIVVLKQDAVLPLALTEAPEDKNQRPLWLARRAARFAEAKQDILQSTQGLGVKVERDYEYLPVTTVQVKSVEALKTLSSHPQVLRVQEDRAYSTSLVESLPLIEQSTALTEGKNGFGTAVAVLDTGADYTRADLGSCTAVGQPASCRVVYAQDFGADDGLLDNTNASLHGTNVSSIVAKVAPGTKIIALDVFRTQYAYTSDIVNAINWVIANKASYNIVAMNLSLGAGKYTATCPSDAMAVAIKNARAAGVLSAVASGNEAYSDGLASPACAPDAISVGAVYDSNLGGLGWGSCTDATTSADKITCFSNSASFLTVLAPGSRIVAGGINMSGTSQASPHVAGVIAVLRGTYAEESLDQIQARLTSTGKQIVDTRNNISKPRINLGAAAAGSCSLTLTPSLASISPLGGEVTTSLSTGSACGWALSSDVPWVSFPQGSSGTGPGTLKFSVEPSDGTLRTATITLAGTAAGVVSRTFTLTQIEDRAAPSGTLTINDGSAWTRTRTVALAINAQDPSGVTSYCVTEADSCSAYEPYATGKAYTLSEAEGSKTVRVFLKDGLGNTSTLETSLKASIQLDLTAPTDGTLTATPAASSPQISLSWSGFLDSLSPSLSYRLVLGNAGAIPANCQDGTLLSSGASTSFIHSGLSPKTSYGYRVCALDAAGQVSVGATAQVTTADVDLQGPTGTVSISNDSPYTRTRTVTLQLSATDPSGVTQMCITQGTSCTSWEAYASSKAFTLANTQGTQTVFAQFRDGRNNVSSRVQDTIVFDSVAPTMGSLSTVSRTSNSITVRWNSATDSVSGLASYKLVYFQGTTYPSTSCTNGTVVALGTSNQVTVTGLRTRTSYSFRLCANDKAGNTSSGVTLRQATL